MSEIILETFDIGKKFGPTAVLQNINLQIKKGEIHALLGENGAGKSTLVKIISGVHEPSTGHFTFEGNVIKSLTPKQAQKLGICIIHQELNLIPEMTVAENIFLGREPGSNLKINRRELNAKANKIMESFDIKFGVDSKIRWLSVAEQQMVEIAKAISQDAKLIIMDEPTDVLTDSETEQLFRLMKKLKSDEKTIIYISHRLDELRVICDRFTVLRDGHFVSTGNVADNTKEDIIQMMVGRKLTEQYPRLDIAKSDEVLKVEGLRKGNDIKDISFTAYAGEILGISGLVGAQRTEMMKCIFGADSFNKGKIYLNKKQVKIKSPKDAIKQGLMYITESRKEFGLILDMPLSFNISLARIKAFINKFWMINKGKERKTTEEYVDKLKIKTDSIGTKVKNLSGGNQQKVLFARCMLTSPKVLIVDEPTRGVDVGARVGIYQTLNELKNEGVAIIVISSDMPEVMGISDRVLVMYKGTITGEFLREELTEDKLAECAFGKVKSN